MELPDGVTPEEAQAKIQEVTGFEPDKAVKDIARCIFMVPTSHTIYVSAKLFESHPRPLHEEGLKKGTRNEEEQSPEAPLPLDGAGESQKFKGVPYTEIIKEWWNRNGGVPAEGERNVKLHKLAVNLRSICADCGRCDCRPRRG